MAEGGRQIQEGVLPLPPHGYGPGANVKSLDLTWKILMYSVHSLFIHLLSFDQL